MIKTAFAYWDSRIAPVFDTAQQIHVVEAESGQIVSETHETLPEDLPVQKTLRMVELGIGTLVCGAVSRALHTMILAYGIRVFPFVAGNLREVIQAFLSDRLDGDCFAMPGCCAQGGRRFTELHAGGREVNTMNRKGRGIGAGGGKGQGQGGQKAGHMGGSSAAGPLGNCVCPKCGHLEPHERGVPCVQKQCPKCGTVMTRQ